LFSARQSAAACASSIRSALAASAIIAAGIVDDLEAALEQFSKVGFVLIARLEKTRATGQARFFQGPTHAQSRA
jgi:hypothetical protein